MNSFKIAIYKSNIDHNLGEDCIDFLIFKFDDVIIEFIKGLRLKYYHLILNLF